MLKRILLGTLFGLIASAGCAGAADVCIDENLRCLETQTITVAGIEVQNVCVRMERTESCTRDAPVNECSVLEPVTVSGPDPLTDGQCELVSETCISSVAGLCDKNERIYHCWNGPAYADPANLDARVFENFTETIDDNCGGIESDANCSLQQTIITEGFATRNFNQQDVTRAWWAQERQYDCTNTLYEDTCQPYDDAPFCTPTGAQTCLNYAPDGSCEYSEITYNCESDTGFESSCEAINVCIGDNCVGAELEISEDYPEAASWLNFLDDISEGTLCDPLAGTDPNLPVSVADCEDGTFENGNTEPEVFGGESMACFMDAFANCCRNPGSSYCGQEPKDLAVYRDAGTTHQLGQRCTSRFLGICLSWRREYCVYNSKLGRVFQEQVDMETGAQFQWRQPEECPALTMDQLETIDVNNMDLSEVFGDMMDDMSEPVQELVMDRISTEVGGYGPQIEDTFE